jgi:hypothetical protein
MNRDKFWVNVMCFVAIAIMVIPLVFWFVDELAK